MFVSFEEIEAWKEARELRKIVRVFCQRAIDKKDWSWADQISRSALSIMANIAEGNDTNTNAEFVVFLGYAKRSSAETRSHLYCGLDEGYMTQEEFSKACEKTKKIGAQLAKLIQYLRRNAKSTRLGAAKKGFALPRCRATEP